MTFGDGAGAGGGGGGVLWVEVAFSSFAAGPSGELWRAPARGDCEA